MTMPTDSSIARAFWEMYTMQMDGFIDCDSVITLAEQFDAESPAGTDASIIDAAKAVIQRWDSPLWRQEVGTADLINDLREAINNAEKVTTSPERVQIPAETTHVRCPKCTGSILAGKWCNGPNCPLRE